jgi:hypothetical protein
MTMHRTMVPRSVPGMTRSSDSSMSDKLLATARRRQARAEELRAWSEDAAPALGHSLRRRAAELELTAVALEMRAEGLEGQPLVVTKEEER